jgi:hypothetical protein
MGAELDDLREAATNGVGYSTRGAAAPLCSTGATEVVAEGPKLLQAVGVQHHVEDWQPGGADHAAAALLTHVRALARSARRSGSRAAEAVLSRSWTSARAPGAGTRP